MVRPLGQNATVACLKKYRCKFYDFGWWGSGVRLQVLFMATLFYVQLQVLHTRLQVMHMVSGLMKMVVGFLHVVASLLGVVSGLGKISGLLYGCRSCSHYRMYYAHCCTSFEYGCRSSMVAGLIYG